MKLRDYQREAIDALYSFFREYRDPSQNPVLALPTGTGKSLCIAGLVSEILQMWPDQKILCLTHVKELIEQNADKLKTYWPQAPLGIYSAGLKEKTAHMPITFGGIQSVSRNVEAFGHIDLILVDECHLVSPNENAAYKTTIAALRAVNPRLRVIGLSATPYRLGLGMITDGGVFTHMAYDITGLRAFNRLLDEGYLSPLIPMPTETIFDVSKVHSRGGEFIAKELEDVVAREDITRKALQETAIAAANRHHWLIFAAGIKHVEMIVRILGELGVSAAAVHSKMDEFERDDNLARFKAGQIRALVNADILTTGFDMPSLDCIVLLRPTMSPGLHVQILGRGTRPFFAPGFDLDTTEGRLAAIAASVKQNCIAEGQLVLTDIGLVPIERVTCAMRVWDGCEFVEHDGVIFKGIQNVIFYDGLWATPDHEVFTARGKLQIGIAASQLESITRAADGWTAIRTTSSGKSRSNSLRWVEGKKREHAESPSRCARVYDILNAGHRHRFTVNGRLVSNCLVLDFAGNTRRLGPINDPRIPRKKGEGGGDIPIKQCSECGCLCHISARECPNCGHEFPINEKLVAKASTAALIVRDEPIVEIFGVDRVTYAPHHKLGSPTSLKVSYYCGLRRFTEWICLEHPGNIRFSAQNWWKARTAIEPPSTIADALPHVDALRVPKQIRVWVNQKHPRVMSAIFE